jgi:hypothetical protein
MVSKSLGSVEVLIPYAADIAAFINRTGTLPISSRRAFKRVLATIKTIALVHQRQRLRDDQGRIIAERIILLRINWSGILSGSLSERVSAIPMNGYCLLIKWG